MKIKPDVIGSFDPLLRDLLLWELVERVEDSSGSGWRLTDRAQGRLDDLVVNRAVPSPDRIMYLDHRCFLCQSRKPTRLREGEYVCDPCAESRTRLEAERLEESNGRDPARGRHARRRGRNGATPPIAS